MVESDFGYAFFDEVDWCLFEGVGKLFEVIRTLAERSGRGGVSVDASFRSFCSLS
jgi:hypothetical protein